MTFAKYGFDEVLVDATRRSPKVQASKYMLAGQFPVVDQGALDVAGYVDDELLVTRVDRPRILFGDHTRRFKYASSDFVLGADGVKALEVLPGFDPRFVFHALRHMQLPSAGYSRHFKFLKAATLLAPDLEEQERIAAILDQADEFRAKRRRTLALLDESKAALFDELFVDQNWPIGRVRELLVSSSYGSAKKAGASGRLPMLRMGNISYEGRLDTTDLKYVDLADNEVEKYTVQRGDVLFNRTNSRERVGKTAMYDLDADMAYAGYLIRLRVKPDHRPEYLAAFMNTARTKSVLRSMAKSIVGMANINAKEVGNMKLPIPSLEAQDDFVDRARSIDHARALAESHLAHLDELFSSLQQRAFTGKL